MRFSVPQFIDVEDKIFAQLTLKQAIYVVGSIAFVIILFIQFGFFIALIFGSPVLLLGFLLSFVKVHGRPFIYVLSSATFYILKSKLYLWKKTPNKRTLNKKTGSQNDKTQPVSIGITQSKLKKLAWSLDTNNIFDKNKHDK